MLRDSLEFQLCPTNLDRHENVRFGGDFTDPITAAAPSRKIESARIKVATTASAGVSAKDNWSQINRGNVSVFALVRNRANISSSKDAANASNPPLAMPAHVIGRVTRIKVRQTLAPSVRAA